MTRRLALLLTALALAVGFPGVAAADAHEGRSGDNAAVAINTRDGSSLFKFAFSIKKVLGEVVDNQNAAVAYASCEQCKTTAIAIQIVLVSGSPDTVVPENYAISINQDCTLCETYSAAFQFVIGVEDPSVGLTKEGKRELRAILREFKALKQEDYTLAEFDAKTRALGERLRTVLKTQLVSRRDDGEAEDADDLDAEEDEESSEDRPAPPRAPSDDATTGATTTGGTTTGGTTTGDTTTGGTTTGGTTTGGTTTGTTTETTPTTTTP